MPLAVLSRVGLASHISRIRNSENVRKVISGPSGSGLVDLPFTLIPLLAITLLSGWLVLVPIAMLMIFYFILKGLERYVKAASPTISSDYQGSFNEISQCILNLKIAGESQGWYQHFMRRAKENSQQNFLYSKRNGLNSAVAHGMGANYRIGLCIFRHFSGAESADVARCFDRDHYADLAGYRTCSVGVCLAPEVCHGQRHYRTV